MAGRKPKLTPELQEKICEYIRAGAFEGVAAEAAGISERTYFRWKAKGEKAQSGIYRQFCQSVKKAMAMGEMSNVLRIQTAASRSWQAAAWFLERKHPERWARKEFKGHLDKQGKPTDPPEEVSRVLVVPSDIDDIHEWSKRAKERVSNAADERERSTDVS